MPEPDLITVFLIFDCLTGNYRAVTEHGRATIAASISLLGYKDDEAIYIRPIYDRDRQSSDFFEGAEWYTTDGNHRVDWWDLNPETRPKTLKCQVFRGKSAVCFLVFLFFSASLTI
jgi:hypothetical protein